MVVHICRYGVFVKYWLQSVSEFTNLRNLDVGVLS